MSESESDLPQPSSPYESSPERPGYRTRQAVQIDLNLSNLITKDRLKQVLKRIDPEQRFDADVEDILVDLTGEFIKNVMKSSCQLAKHRRSDTLEAHDAQLYTEKIYNIRIPGFGIDSQPELLKKASVPESHANKVAIVREASRKLGVTKRSSRLRARQQIKQ